METIRQYAEQLVVVDVPFGSTPEEAAALLTRLGGDYYLVSVVTWPPTGARAFFKQRATPQTDRNGQKRLGSAEARALQYLRDNRELPVTHLAAGCKALHFTRSTAWIKAKLREIIAAERSIQ